MKRPYPRWQRRHEVVLCWMIANLRGKQKDCAVATGYSSSQISRIINSPDFQRHYRAAREVIESEVSRSRIEQINKCSKPVQSE